MNAVFDSQAYVVSVFRKLCPAVLDVTRQHGAVLENILIIKMCAIFVLLVKMIFHTV